MFAYNGFMSDQANRFLEELQKAATHNNLLDDAPQKEMQEVYIKIRERLSAAQEDARHANKPLMIFLTSDHIGDSVRTYWLMRAAMKELNIKPIGAVVEMDAFEDTREVSLNPTFNALANFPLFAHQSDATVVEEMQREGLSVKMADERTALGPPDADGFLPELLSPSGVVTRNAYMAFGIQDALDAVSSADQPRPESSALLVVAGGFHAYGLMHHYGLEDRGVPVVFYTSAVSPDHLIDALSYSVEQDRTEFPGDPALCLQERAMFWLKQGNAHLVHYTENSLQTRGQIRDAALAAADAAERETPNLEIETSPILPPYCHVPVLGSLLCP